MNRRDPERRLEPPDFPEDNGLRLCNECGEDIKVDLTDAKEAEVEEFDNCYSHLKTVEELQEYAFLKVKDIYYWKRKARAWEELHNVNEKDDAQTIAALKERIKDLEQWVEKLEKIEKGKESLLQEAFE